MSQPEFEKYQRHYSDDRFWKKIKNWGRKLGLKAVYAALVLYYALDSPEISTRDKALIWGALGYLILPVDLIPDFLPVTGLTDDVAALILAVYKVANNITPQVRSRAEEKLHEWFGDYDRQEIHIENFNDSDIDEQ